MPEGVALGVCVLSCLSCFGFVWVSSVRNPVPDELAQGVFQYKLDASLVERKRGI